MNPSKGTNIGHARLCKGGRCRGGCWKFDDPARYSIDNSQIGRKKASDNVFVTTGATGQGKSAEAIRLASQFQPFGSTFKFGVENFDLHSAYSKMKADRIAQVTEERDRRNYWETLGRLLGMAYNESDEAFFALLEGFYQGRLNETKGGRAMGGRKE